MLFKKLSKQEVLEVILMVASEAIPENIEGEISAYLNKDGSAEIFFIPKTDKNKLN